MLSKIIIIILPQYRYFSIYIFRWETKLHLLSKIIITESKNKMNQIIKEILEKELNKYGWQVQKTENHGSAQSTIQY